MWLRSKELIKKLNITRQSLYSKCKKGYIKSKKEYGTKYYWIDDEKENNNTNKFNAIYCRVSNNKQKNDLDNQERLLKEYAASNGYKIDYTFKEIASGMNEERNKLDELINLVLENKINKIFITYKDRLTRFGFNYFEKIFKKINTEIEVININNAESFEKELTNDLISIIHHFSMKMYSNRRKKLNKIKKELNNN